MTGSETIVVIDDDKETRTLVEIALARAGRTLVGFGEGDEALRFLAAADRIDLVISDVAMEGYDGHRLLRHLRADPNSGATPVIFVTGGVDGDGRIGGLRDRGVEQLHKPFDIAALRSLVDEVLRRGPVAVAPRDDATGLQSGDRFHEELSKALRAASGAAAPLAVVLVDIESRPDGPVSDAVLRRVADIISLQLRATDWAARLHAATFATLHPACDASGATAIAERILAAVDAEPLCAGASVAVGIAATKVPDAEEAAVMLETADDAVRKAKSLSGKRLCVGEMPGTTRGGGA
jgi:diguanylate cyclase (GGDEF)-like protein